MTPATQTSRTPCKSIPTFDRQSQMFHATNSAGNICSQSFSLILNSASSDIQAEVSNRSPHLLQDQRLTTKRSLTNSDQSGTNSVSPHLAQVVPWSVLLME